MSPPAKRVLKAIDCEAELNEAASITTVSCGIGISAPDAPPEDVDHRDLSFQDPPLPTQYSVLVASKVISLLPPPLPTRVPVNGIAAPAAVISMKFASVRATAAAVIVVCILLLGLVRIMFTLPCVVPVVRPVTVNVPVIVILLLTTNVRSVANVGTTDMSANVPPPAIVWLPIEALVPLKITVAYVRPPVCIVVPNAFIRTVDVPGLNVRPVVVASVQGVADEPRIVTVDEPSVSDRVLELSDESVPTSILKLPVSNEPRVSVKLGLVPVNEDANIQDPPAPLMVIAPIDFPAVSIVCWVAEVLT
jgi:hypothetical protein